MRRRSPEVALQCVVVDCLLEHSRRIFRVVFPVALVCVCQGVRRIVRLLQVIRFDPGGLFECLSCFPARVLDAEGVRGVFVELGGPLELLRLTAKEREAGACR